MIHKFTDSQLREMGVAEYHIKKWYDDEIIQRAIEQTRRDFSVLFGSDDSEWREDFERIAKSMPSVWEDIKKKG